MDTFSRLLKKIEVCEHGFSCEVCCWPWSGATAGKHSQLQYPRFNLNHKSQLGHRVLFFCMYGKFPEKLLLHTCDNSRCMNYHHHYEGDHLDNSKDAYTRKRMPLGENHWAVKLNSEKVIEIRRLYSLGNTSYGKLAKLFNVSATVIQYIIERRTWKQIP